MKREAGDVLFTHGEDRDLHVGCAYHQFRKDIFEKDQRCRKDRREMKLGMGCLGTGCLRVGSEGLWDVYVCLGECSTRAGRKKVMYGIE
jgi:hypothetical protein